MNRPKTIDLRSPGLSREQWREVWLEAKKLGVPMEALAQVAVADLTPVLVAAQPKTIATTAVLVSFPATA